MLVQTQRPLLLVIGDVLVVVLVASWIPPPLARPSPPPFALHPPLLSLLRPLLLPPVSPSLLSAVSLVRRVLPLPPRVRWQTRFGGAVVVQSSQGLPIREQGGSEQAQPGEPPLGSESPMPGPRGWRGELGFK